MKMKRTVLYMAALGKWTPGKLPVETEVHNCLQDLGTGPVQFVEEEDYRLSVRREPVRRHEVCPAGVFIQVGESDEVSRVGHLSEEQCDHLESLFLEVSGQELRLADSVVADEHDVVCGRRAVQH